jgi:hypothetical protein
MADTHITLHIEGLPDVLFEIRRRMAAKLRREAAVETHPFTRRRLLAIAAAFEVGLEGAQAPGETEC